MNIKLELTLEETNLLMQSLGQMPYVQVASLVEKIREQARPQIQTETKTE